MIREVLPELKISTSMYVCFFSMCNSMVKFQKYNGTTVGNILDIHHRIVDDKIFLIGEIFLAT